MQLRTLGRYTMRQIQLPSEYHQKLIRVKQIIQNITGIKPNSETLVMCLLDEFINAHNQDVEEDHEINP